MFRLLGRSADSWFDLPAPRGTYGTYVFSYVHVFRLLGRSLDLWFDLLGPRRTYGTYAFHVFMYPGFSAAPRTHGLTYPPPAGLMELMFLHMFMCFGFSDAPWTYGLTYPPPWDLWNLCFSCIDVLSGSRASRGLIVSLTRPPRHLWNLFCHVFWLVRVASRARRGRAARWIRQAIPAAGAAEGSGGQIYTFLKRNVPKTELDRVSGSPFSFKPNKIISRTAKIAGQTPFLQGFARFSGTAQRNATFR